MAQAQFVIRNSLLLVLFHNSCLKPLDNNKCVTYSIYLGIVCLN